VRLAALDLSQISGLDLDGSELGHRISGIPCFT